MIATLHRGPTIHERHDVIDRSDAMPRDLDPIPPTYPLAVPVSLGASARTQRQLATIDTLLGHLDETRDGDDGLRGCENQLLAVRLGVASGLFTALRVKHGPTADHALRVALACSSWSQALDLPRSVRDEIEVTALLHDLGKMGVPDSILRKPSALTPEQAASVSRARALGLKILVHCVPDPLLCAISHVRAWYDGSRPEYLLSGGEIPLPARIVHIVDVFDTMTTGTIYRQAVSKELAIAELFRAAGSQFDPELVQGFADAEALGHLNVPLDAHRVWLVSLTTERADDLWRLRIPDETTQRSLDETGWFLEELFDGLPDAIMFLDSTATILHWSRGAEQLTGLPASATEQRQWLPSLLALRDASGVTIRDDQCPITEATRQGNRMVLRMTVGHRNGESFPVDVHVLPVMRPKGMICGCVVVFRDASSQSDLEARVRSLHERATTDPLTGLSNRAEFDRSHAEAVRHHLFHKTPCSLIICDIDHFKSINDKFGHQAGDQAIITFAKILRRSCRSGDLVARYGGEEFVVIGPQCDITEATQLAEKIRFELTQTPLEVLAEQNITASFGVTELQPGDSPATMLRRADRGLLRAKDTGRNRVVQLGNGMQGGGDAGSGSPWWSWMRPRASKQLSERHLYTIVPLQVAIEKLRGFIADHEAEVLTIDGYSVSMRISCVRFLQQRRDSDRAIPLVLDLEFSEEPWAMPRPEEVPAGMGTFIRIRVQATRDRDRRGNPADAARQLVNSLKAYLMALELTATSTRE